MPTVTETGAGTPRHWQLSPLEAALLRAPLDVVADAAAADRRLTSPGPALPAASEAVGA